MLFPVRLACRYRPRHFNAPMLRTDCYAITRPYQRERRENLSAGARGAPFLDQNSVKHRPGFGLADFNRQFSVSMGLRHQFRVDFLHLAGCVRNVDFGNQSRRGERYFSSGGT